MSKRVVLGMSGGVDSSVAAVLLKEQGYDVIGLFMRNWDSTANRDVLGNPTLEDDTCPQAIDYEDAKRVAETLEIPLHRVDFIEEYWRDVFAHFLDEHRRGRTPNPDILCNKHIKFDAFANHASRFNPDYIAMGHYARVKRNGAPRLFRGRDANKDQTYFLSQLSSKQLNNVLFPVGDLNKGDVRRLAEQHNLPTADKKDSTGICFIGERHFAEFLNNYLPAQPGPIKTFDGDEIGRHTGLMHYTIGQRKGLGIGGSDRYGNDPWFVAGKDLDTNTLIVVQGFHHEALYADACTVEDLNVIVPGTPLENRDLQAKFRHRQKDTLVRVIIQEGVVTVRFARPVRAVTPGQACVLYDGEECLGGGTISSALNNGKPLPY